MHDAIRGRLNACPCGVILILQLCIIKIQIPKAVLITDTGGWHRSRGDGAGGQPKKRTPVDPA
jgi:hypothetical protein